MQNITDERISEEELQEVLNEAFKEPANNGELAVDASKCEECVLGILIQDYESAQQIINNGLKTEHFQIHRNRLLYPIILDIRAKKGTCNVDFIAHECEKLGILEQIGSYRGLTEIILSPISTDLKTAQGYVDMLLERYERSKGCPQVVKRFPGILPMEDYHKLIAALPKIKWHIEGLVPVGAELVLPTGRTGVGKSFFVLQMGLSFVTGEPFLGRKVEPCEVLYMGFEGLPEMLDLRVETMSRSYPTRLHDFRIGILKPLKFNTKHGENELRTSIGDAKIVIADPLSLCCDGDIARDRTKVNAWLETVNNISHDKGCTFIVPHHVRKTDTRSVFIEIGDLDSIKGCGELVERANTVFLIEQLKRQTDERGRFVRRDPQKFVLHVPKHRDAIDTPQEMELYFDRQKLLFEIIDAPKKPVSESNAKLTVGDQLALREVEYFADIK